MLPYLRDDHVYDNAIVWQNTTYNQPPHVSYSPVVYWKELQEILTGICNVSISDTDTTNNATYNIAGQRINPSYLQNGGIVIRNGKKYMK